MREPLAAIAVLFVVAALWAWTVWVLIDNGLLQALFGPYGRYQ